jgi:hypothetical protein
MRLHTASEDFDPDTDLEPNAHATNSTQPKRPSDRRFGSRGWLFDDGKRAKLIHDYWDESFNVAVVAHISPKTRSGPSEDQQRMDCCRSAALTRTAASRQRTKPLAR